jgi:hypothetical protein
MPDFQPKKGLALVAFQKQPSADVQPKNGLLLPTKPTEETLVRGQIILVDDPENYFRDGDMIVVAPADIIGEFNSEAGASFLINAKDILGKVVG